MSLEKNKNFIILSIYIFLNISSSSSPISYKFLISDIWPYSINNYIFSDRSSKIRSILNKYDFSSDVVSVQNSILYYPIANSKFEIVLFPNFNNANVNYVIIDLKKPIFYVDKGCEYISNKCLNDIIYHKYLDSVSLLDGSYILIENYDDFRIYKRKI